MYIYIYVYILEEGPPSREHARGYVFSEIQASIQSASHSPPGLASSKFCTVPHIFLPKMFKKQDGMLAFFGALFEYFFHLRGRFLSNFRPLEAFWGSYGLIFVVKK